MSTKLFLIGCLSVWTLGVAAQTSRPGVLVLGNNEAAAAAAIQSAVSGVKTTLLLPSGNFEVAPLRGGLASGIQAEFITRLRAASEKAPAKKGDTSDSTRPAANHAVPSFDKQTANAIWKQWVDTLSNLTVIRGNPYVKAGRAGKNWVFKLRAGQTLRPEVLIVTGDTMVLHQLNIRVPVRPADSLAMPLDYGQTLYRTSVAAGMPLKEGSNATPNDSPRPNADDQSASPTQSLTQNLAKSPDNATFFSLYNMLVPQEENLIWLAPEADMPQGQAAGAAAAWAGFYHKNTSESNLKAIQGELLNYKQALMPYADIALNDPNWKAIQFVGLTGTLQARLNGGTARFMPDQEVSLAEIAEPLKAFYYKAQLWFDDHQEQKLSLAMAIDLVSYVGDKSAESTTRQLEKKWQSSYKLPEKFDLKKILNRREFALILQDYMPPFNVNIDQKGKVLR